MSHVHGDVHGEFFTPPEFPVEILNKSKEKDVIPCCLPPSAKQFFAFSLLKEYYHKCDGILVFIQEDPDTKEDGSSTDQVGENNLSSNDFELNDSEQFETTESHHNHPKSEFRNLPPKPPPSPPQCDPPLESLSSIPVVNLRKMRKYVESLKLQRLLDENRPAMVLICSKKEFLQLICDTNEFSLKILARLRLIIIDNVHEALRDSQVKRELMHILGIVKSFSECRYSEGYGRIRMVYLTVSLLDYYGYQSNGFWRMEETFKKLEQLCEAKVDTSSDTVALLRYSGSPTERIISYTHSYASPESETLTLEVKEIVANLKKYFHAHEYNPVEAMGYDQKEWDRIMNEKEEKSTEVVLKSSSLDNGDENLEETDSLLEEIKNIVHPRVAPLAILQQFESVLDLFGPWCAQRSLHLLIIQIEKMKTRVPYVRHYLLLGLLHTRFLLIQAVFQSRFSEYKPLEVLEKFSTPKILAVLHILRRYNLTTVHEGKLLRQEQERLQQQQECNDEENEVTVADFLNSQRHDQSMMNSRFRGGRSGGGRRRNCRVLQGCSDLTTSKLRKKIISSGDGEGGLNNKSVTFEESGAKIIELPPEATEESLNSLILSSDEPLPNEIPLINRNGFHEVSKESVPSPPVQDDVDKEVADAVEAAAAATQLEADKQQFYGKFNRRNRNLKPNEDALCGIVLIADRFHARLLYHFLREAADVDPKLIGLSPTIALSSNPDYSEDSREAEIEYKRREENLRKFRYREANFLVGTSLLEDGIELPKANLVIRFDEAKSFRSYLFSKGRAQGVDAEYYVFTNQEFISHCLRQLATYKAVEETLLSHTIITRPRHEPTNLNSKLLETLNLKIPIFKTASLSNSISVVNRYCARLPSDTFTRLTPIWHLHKSDIPNQFLSTLKKDSWYSCTLRLPINSPVKWPLKGAPMPTQDLAKQAVAVHTVMVLHKHGELDDALMPVGKEGVVPEPDLCITSTTIEEIVDVGEMNRPPGSTKRRQYYDKQLAPELVDCLPGVNKPFYLYWLRMTLTCPLPDDQNTRGRKLHPPEDASQCFGIALSKEIPPMPPFPIYTRCGEVLVELVGVSNPDIPNQLTEERREKISAFHHYTFTSVLRLDKYLTLFDPTLSENSYYVVPLRSCGGESLKNSTVKIDWQFIDRISKEKDLFCPIPKPDQSRKDYVFHEEEYVDAVVMPWYRNNDQPQYFYVAEICKNLTPRSQFPGCEFKTFEEYYRVKYNLRIQHPNQPLLDVDHTSARLNFLTPRYVNRKGMALPTSSESTKKAKRENLEQKQILVPELCAIHPFTASLWRQAVCLPCILYRMNALLMANNIRTLVANQIHGLGLAKLETGFKWEPLSFGWSLSDIFSSSSGGNSTPAVKSTSVKTEEGPKQEVKNNGNENAKDKEAEAKEASKLSDTEKEKKPEVAPKDKAEKGKEPTDKKLSGFEKAAKEAPSSNMAYAESLLGNDHKGKSVNELLSEEMKKCRQPQLEIGVWTNDMASGASSNEPDYDEEEDELLDPNIALPSNLMMINQKVSWGGRYKLFNHKVHRALYGSPTHWGEVWDRTAFEPPEDFDEIDNASIHSDMSGSDESFLDGDNNLKIQFEGNTAEALDKRKFGAAFEHRLSEEYRAQEDLWWDNNDESDVEVEKELEKEFDEKVDSKVKEIQNVVMWDEIENLSPRLPKRNSSGEEVENEVTEQLNNLIRNAEILGPPQCSPESERTKTPSGGAELVVQGCEDSKDSANAFSFDFQPSLVDHVGPSPCQILQALTMSNANDGLNLERLETIGDSFLKYAITTYLFCSNEIIHEGKLSHLRSKHVSNVHLYKLGKQRGLGGLMIAAKFEPHDNWLPPCYHISKDLDRALLQSDLAQKDYSMAQVNALNGLPKSEIELALRNPIKSNSEFIPYNLVTQQSIPDKSIADSVEALIGAYLTSTGPFGALLFMSWLGVRVLPSKVIPKDEFPAFSANANKPIFYMEVPNQPEYIVFEQLKPPVSPLLQYERSCQQKLKILLKGYDGFEDSIGYKFRDRSYLLQAFTHASYATNELTDCYQRLEFLGDAILDYLITRHLYEDPRQHSPGSLTDLRSALVNNTIFASLAVKNGFHKYFRHSSPRLSVILQKFVTFQEQHSHTLSQDYYLVGEEECDEAEDIEVPKALGDVFESIAGAVYLDSGLSLDAVWNVYFRIMKNEIEKFSENVPKSPIRELLELEPETAKFGKPEKLWDGKRIRVMVEINGVGSFRGIGRNYRIAKCTAAKCALRHLRKVRKESNKDKRMKEDLSAMHT